MRFKSDLSPIGARNSYPISLSVNGVQSMLWWVLTVYLVLQAAIFAVVGAMVIKHVLSKRREESRVTANNNVAEEQGARTAATS